jgi:hypothetical protein
MKTSAFRLVITTSLLLSLTLTSCAPYGPGYSPGGWGGPGAPTGADAAVGGALLGAVAGGIIGNQSRRGLQGAAIGGILGALAGSAIQQSRERRAWQTHGRPDYGCQQPYQPSFQAPYEDGGYYRPQNFGRPSYYDPYGWH